MTRRTSPPRGWYIAPEGPQCADVHLHRSRLGGIQALVAAESGRVAVVDAEASIRSNLRARVGRLVGPSGPPSEPDRAVVRIQQ